jgi:hypothetical protein
MPTTITYSAELTTCECWCGIHLAIPSNLYRNAHETSQEVYCPVGHKFHWSESESDRLRKKLEQVEARASRAEQRRQAERDLREHTERQLRAQKGATTRAKRRHAAALCPCCNRSFVQLRRHLETKHPDYKPDAADDSRRTDHGE